MCSCPRLASPPHASPPHASPGRRTLLRGAAVAGMAVPLGGCEVEDYIPNLLSRAQIDALGDQTWARINTTTPRSSDERRQDIVRGVTAGLLQAHGEQPQAWEVALFAGQQVNAFALPGRRIGVFEGMFRVAQNRAQLAAVLGHEIGHVVSRHAETRMNAELVKNLGLSVIRIALGVASVPFGPEIAAALGAGTDFGLLLPFSRQQELQADRFGVFAMARAGFDPAEAVALWRRMDEMVPQRGPTFLATHPAPRTRVQALEELVAEARSGKA